MRVIPTFTALCFSSWLAGCSDAGSGTLGSPWAAGGMAVSGGGNSAAGGAAASGSASGGAFANTAAGAATAGISAGGSLAGAGMGGTGGEAGQAGASSSGGSAGGVAAALPENQVLFNTNCGLCHGEQGKGGLLAPEIQHPVRDYALWVVRNGRAQTSYAKPMEKVGPDMLSDAQLTLIFDYLAQPPQPTTGKALFDDYCANCHGADARGGPTDRDITGEVGKIQELVRGGKSIGQYQMRHDSMPKFSTSLVNDAELLLIRDYVDSL